VAGRVGARVVPVTTMTNVGYLNGNLKDGRIVYDEDGGGGALQGLTRTEYESWRINYVFGILVRRKNGVVLGVLG